MNKSTLHRWTLGLALLLAAATATAQPAKRRVQPKQTQQEAKAATSDRAAISFPVSEAMPEDVSWRRDIYRVINLLEKDKNAALYYPVQPIGRQCNLFTYLFRLVLTGRVKAYKYTLDGNETFTETNRLQIKEMLDNYSIFYEEKDGRYNVADVDVPSEEVTRYYIKESNYLDQRTNDMRTRVTALCPVLMRVDDFGDQAEPTPLFWLRYDDVATYLSKLPVMTSNLNNVTNMTADDYFTLNLYEADIYKTNNMQGRILVQYCQTDSALTKERKRIEGELSDFNKHLWAGTVKADTTDTLTLAAAPAKKRTTRRPAAVKEKEEAVEEKPAATSRRSQATKTKKTKESSAQKPARVSVRRQRR